MSICNQKFIQTFNKLKVDCPTGFLTPDNVMFYGAKGDGVTNDTSAIQRAINSMNEIFFPSGTYLISAILTVSSNHVFYGVGESSCIKLADNSNVSMFRLWTNNTINTFRDLCFDYNSPNNSYVINNSILSIRGEGTGGQIFQVTVDNCIFKNQGYSSVDCNFLTNNTNRQIIVVKNSYFLGGYNPVTPNGADSPRYIDVFDAQIILIDGNYFDPLIQGEYGIVAISISQPGLGPFSQYNKATVISNTVIRCGRGNSASGAGGLGAIDFYKQAGSIVISNNRCINCQAAGIRGKNNANGCVISSNLVEGMASVEYSGGIVVVGSTDPGNVSEGFVIIGNCVKDLPAGCDGIVAGGDNVDGITFADGMIIANNVVKNSGRRGIYAYGWKNVQILGNYIDTCIGATGVGIQTTLIRENLMIKDNYVNNTASIGIWHNNGTLATHHIYNNVVRNCSNHGIFLDEGVDAYLINNYVNTTTGTGIFTTLISGEAVVRGGFIKGMATPLNISATTRSYIDYPSISLTLTVSPSRTIAAGVITINSSYVRVDTEGAGATDDLDTINGAFYIGQMLTLSAVNSARDVVVKDGTGNIQCAGDFTMNNLQDTISLVWTGTVWLETCRSDNGA